MPTTYRGSWFIALGFAALAFVGSLLVGHAFFENLSVNNDEAVYVLEAQAFANGQLTLSDSAHGDAFRPWMSGRVEGDRLVLVEQPLLPAAMALTDTLFGSMRVAVGLIAAGAVLTMFALARELLRDDRVALVAAGCFVLSPLVIIQSAMYVSYVLAVGLAAATLTLVTRGLDRRSDGRRSRAWLIGGGTVHGVLLLSRPLEGITLGVVILVWMALRRVGARDIARIVGLMAAGAAPVLALCLLYNELTTGNPFVFALWTIGGDDSFGFGRRAVAEHAVFVDVGPAESWLALRTNLRAFPHWIFGGLASIPLGTWGGWQLWRGGRHDRRVLWLLVTMLVAYPVVYLFYYGNYLVIAGRNIYGPHYYLALLIPSMLLLALGLVDICRRRWPWVAGTVVALVAASAIEIPDKVRRNLDIRDDIAAEVAAVTTTVEEPAVVIVPAGIDGPYVLHPRGALANPPDLDAPVLFAADLGGRNLDLLDRFPDRRIYRLQRVRTTDGFVPEVDRLLPERGDEVRFRVAARPTPGEPDSVTAVNIGDERLACESTSAAGGTVEVAVAAGRASVSGCAGGDRSVALAEGPLTVSISLTDRDGAGSSDPDGASVEARFWVRTGSDGVVALAPGELWWRRPGGQGFEVVSADLVPWVDADVVAGLGSPQR